MVPVFVGNEKIEGEKSLYSRVSATVAATGFPDLPHARSDDANRIVQDFGYLFHSSSLLFLFILLCFPCSFL